MRAGKDPVTDRRAYIDAPIVNDLLDRYIAEHVDKRNPADHEGGGLVRDLLRHKDLSMTGRYVNRADDPVRTLGRGRCDVRKAQETAAGRPRRPRRPTAR